MRWKKISQWPPLPLEKHIPLYQSWDLAGGWGVPSLNWHLGGYRQENCFYQGIIRTFSHHLFAWWKTINSKCLCVTGISEPVTVSGIKDVREEINPNVRSDQSQADLCGSHRRPSAQQEVLIVGLFHAKREAGNLAELLRVCTSRSFLDWSWDRQVINSFCIKVMDLVLTEAYAAVREQYWLVHVSLSMHSCTHHSILIACLSNLKLCARSYGCKALIPVGTEQLQGVQRRGWFHLGKFRGGCM